jgi:hypothetical protein
MEAEEDHMKIWAAAKNDDGTVTAVVEVGRNEKTVGLKDHTYQPDEDEYAAALAVAQGHNQEKH